MFDQETTESAQAPHAQAPRLRRPPAERVGVAVMAFCLLAAVGLWALILQYTQSERLTTLEAANTANDAMALAVEEQIVRTLRDVRQIGEVVRYEYGRSGAASDVNHILRALSLSGEKPDTVLLVDETGTVIGGNVPQAHARNLADRDYFRAQRDSFGDGLYINQPVPGRIPGQWFVPMSLPLRDSLGRFKGVVVVSLTPEQLIGSTRVTNVGDGGIVTLVGLDGIVRARRTGQVASQGQDISRSPTFQVLGHMPNGNTMGAGALDGRIRLFSHRTLERYPLIVVVGTEYDVVMASFLRQRQHYLELASLASVLMIGFGLSVWLALARQARTAQRLHDREALIRATFDHAALGLARVAADGSILGWNRRFERMLRRPQMPLLGCRLENLVAPQADPTAVPTIEELLTAAAHERTPEAERPYRSGSGGELWLHEAYGAVHNAQGDLAYVVVALQDVTERRRLEQQLAHAAHHDPLTGLPNRALLRDRLHQALAQAPRRNARVGVLYLDLDGFKLINDSFGHAAGDQLLHEVARRLRACVRAEDTIGRLGGDEFALVLADVPDITACQKLAEKLIDILRQSIALDAKQVHIGASVGIALESEGDDGDALLRRADDAMYTAKRAGRGRSVVAVSPSPPGTESPRLSSPR